MDYFDALIEDFKEFTNEELVVGIDHNVPKTEEERKEYGTSAEEYRRFLVESQRYIHELAGWHAEALDQFKLQATNLAQRPQKGTLLDFGAGIGTRAAPYAVGGWRVLLVELNRRCREFADWRFKKHNIEGVEIAVEIKLPEWKGTVDELLVIDVIGHLPDPAKSVQELGEVTKPGGIMHVTWDAWFDSGEGHVHRNKEVDFKALFRRHGFEELNEATWMKRFS